MNDLTRNEEAYKVAYDLTACHAVHPRGSIMVWMTWNRITGVPCMVLTPKDAHLSHERVIPCVIPLTMAWKWDDKIGDPLHINSTSYMFCANLGWNPNNVRNILKLQTIIHDLLEDLIRMPPMPDDTRVVSADAIITDNVTGKTVHKEITDHA